MPRLGHGPIGVMGPQDGGAVLRTGEPLGRGTAKELPGDLPVAPSMHTSREVMIGPIGSHSSRRRRTIGLRTSDPLFLEPPVCSGGL